jgi:hypothetical protein
VTATRPVEDERVLVAVEEAGYTAVRRGAPRHTASFTTGATRGSHQVSPHGDSMRTAHQLPPSVRNNLLLRTSNRSPGNPASAPTHSTR